MSQAEEDLAALRADQARLHLQVAEMRMAIQLASGALATGRNREAREALARVPPPGTRAGQGAQNRRVSSSERRALIDRRTGERRTVDT